jgi:hypothetical protein
MSNANPEFKSYLDSILNSKNMGVGLRDSAVVKKETSRVAKIIGLSPYQMSNTDFSKLTPEQRYEMDKLIITREQGLKSKVPDWVKKDMDNFSQVIYAGEQISRGLNSSDTGLVNSTYNKINQYLGFGESDNLAKRTLTQSSYDLYKNFMRKAMSGLAVTKTEGMNFDKSFGTLALNDLSVAVKVMNNMKSLTYKLDNLKKSYDPISFNYRYGGLSRTAINSVQRMESIIKGYNSNGQESNKEYVNANGSQHQDEQELQKTVARTGTYQGQKVIEYSDGSVDYE